MMWHIFFMLNLLLIYIALVHPGPPRKQMPKVEVVTFEDPLKKPRVQQKPTPDIKIVRPICNNVVMFLMLTSHDACPWYFVKWWLKSHSSFLRYSLQITSHCMSLHPILCKHISQYRTVIILSIDSIGDITKWHLNTLCVCDQEQRLCYHLLE